MRLAKLLLLFIISISSMLYSQVQEVANNTILTQQEKVILDQMGIPTNNVRGTTNDPNRGIIQWSEGFEGTTFPPTGWTRHNLDGGTNQWDRYTSTPIFGTASAAVRWESSTLTNDDWLITHQFLVNSGDMLKFWAKGSGTYFDSVQIYYSLTGGTPPTDYTHLVTYRPIATAALYQVSLNALAGQNVYIGFRYYALDELRLYVDSVYVETPVADDAGVTIVGVPSVLEPGNFTPTATVKNFGANTASFNVTMNIGSYTSTKAVSNLVPDATSNVTFDNWVATIGIHEVKVYTQLTGDLNAANDTLKKSVSVSKFLYSNGQFVTNPGQGAGGTDLSVLQTGWNILGSGMSQAGPFRIADDFTVDTTTTITSFTFFGYQTGSTTTSTFTGVNLRIWSGEPGTGTVVYGNITTNVLSSHEWSNAYRVTTTTLTDVTRPIMAITASVNVTLNPGTYWVDFQTSGTLTSGPWAVPITIVGNTGPTGNAVQGLTTGVFQPANDSGGTVGVIRLGYPFIIRGLSGSITPVELTSFNASVDNRNVILSWITASELNNYGFEVERKYSDGEFERVAFIEGKGTSAETNSYVWYDNDLSVGSYTYRLKQIDFDGPVSYSKEVFVDVSIPDQYSLNQNYPNPFNPVTKIEFSLASESKVTLKMYNTLGEEVTTLVNKVMPAGMHNVNYDASKLNSGVYFYSIEATGSNGTNFTSVKKMVLMK
jgi:hypothetical protein